MPKKNNDELDAAQPKTEPAVTAEATPKSAKKPASSAAPASATTSESTESVAAVAAAASAGEATAPSSSAKSPIIRVPRDLKKTAIITGSVLVGVLAVVIIIFGVLVYGYKSANPVVAAVSSVVPYPVEKVNGTFVSYHDYLFEVNANEKAYQSNAKLNNQPAVDFNSTDGKKLVVQIKQHALDKLKSDAVVAQLAAQKKVTVSQKDINDLINQLYQRYGGKDTLLKTLNQIYGWNLNDLNKVVYKQLLAQKLQDKVASDPALDAQAKAKAQDVLNKTKADGADFGALAKQYSQASDASTGGDLGNVAKGQLPTDEETAMNALQPGEVSGLVKTQYGYEVIKVIDRSGDTTHAQHILIETIDFNSYFNDQLKKAKVNTYLKV
ncbi:MAG TPA: peptidylprolyl isomerase [Candidatus Saccharimonadia bacterium]|nr:peptidylprolyl isomerase [Candidatus Saccharimonadia bacterium]